MEELCVCFQENAFLLDGEIMTDELINWIDKECGVRDLAKTLYPLVHKRGVLSEFIVSIMEYVGILDLNGVGQTESILKKSAGRSILERKKLKADHLLHKGKHLAALLCYESLLREWDTAVSSGSVGRTAGGAAVFRSGILHNKGVALTRMMRYADGADCFWEAYELEPAKDSLVAYLGAMRLYLEEGEYIAFLSEHPQFFEASLLLEKRMEESRQNWQTNKPYARVWGQMGEASAEKWDGMMKELKERYRRSMS
jgi:tetratricopeptide (TPR) repeat protein